MSKQTESEIKNLVSEANQDRDLSAFLDTLLDSSRSLPQIMTLRRVDLLLSDGESGVALKWLVWADESAMDSDLNRIKDYRRRTSFEMDVLVSEFLEVLNTVFQQDDSRLAPLPILEALLLEKDDSDQAKERIKKFKRTIEKSVKNKKWRRDLIESLMSYILSVAKSGMLMDLFIELPISRLNNLLSATGISHSDYTDALGTLVNFELVLSQFTLFWCDECSPIPRTLFAPYIERPSKLEMNCPTCSKKMNTVSLLEPCEEIINWLNAKDGLLAVLVGYALEREELNWNANILEERETDLFVELVNHDMIIETKVHRIYQEKDREALVSTLNKDLCQLAQTCETLSKNRNKPVVGALVWNQNIPSDLAKQTRRSESVSKRYDPNKLLVVSLSEISKFVRNISKPTFEIPK